MYQSQGFQKSPRANKIPPSETFEKTLQLSRSFEMFEKPDRLLQLQKFKNDSSLKQDYLIENSRSSSRHDANRNIYPFEKSLLNINKSQEHFKNPILQNLLATSQSKLRVVPLAQF